MFYLKKTQITRINGKWKMNSMMNSLLVQLAFSTTINFKFVQKHATTTTITTLLECIFIKLNLSHNKIKKRNC